MTETKSPGNEPDNNEEPDIQSDARIILGPLVRHAAIGLVIVGIIIATAVTLDSQFNTIDREVAELKAQLAMANPETEVEAKAVQQEPAVSAVSEVTEAETPATSPAVENSVDANPAVTQAATQKVEADVSVTETAVTDKTRRHSDLYDRSFDEFIAERNQYLEGIDRAYLEEFQASRERLLQFRRQRLPRQEQKIQELEQRNQEIYDYRATSEKERQQMRESFLPDRI